MDVNCGRIWEPAVNQEWRHKWKDSSFALHFCLYSFIGLCLLYSGLANFFLRPLNVLLAKIIGEILHLTGLPVIVMGQKVVLSGIFGIEIATECSGAPLLLLFFSGLLAYPISNRYRLIGLILAVFTVFAGNVIRLVSLFWIGVKANQYFELSHSYIWNGIIYTTVVYLWILLLRSYKPPASEKANKRALYRPRQMGHQKSI